MQKSLIRQKIQMVEQKENTWQVLQQRSCVRDSIFQETLDKHWSGTGAALGQGMDATTSPAACHQQECCSENTIKKKHHLETSSACHQVNSSGAEHKLRVESKSESRNLAMSSCLSLWSHVPGLGAQRPRARGERADVPAARSRLPALCLSHCHPQDALPASLGVDLPLIQSRCKNERVSSRSCCGQSQGRGLLERGPLSKRFSARRGGTGWF